MVAEIRVLGIPAPSGPIRDPAGVLGERSPLAVGASGRVILAHLPDDEITALNPRGTACPRIERIRELGYETSYGENHPSINGISAPLLSDNHAVLGSMPIAGLADRLLEPVIGRLQDLSPGPAASSLLTWPASSGQARAPRSTPSTCKNADALSAQQQAEQG